MSETKKELTLQLERTIGIPPSSATAKHSLPVQAKAKQQPFSSKCRSRAATAEAVQQQRSRAVTNVEAGVIVIGEMAEWSIASVLKTDEGHTSGGSNPSLSARKPDFSGFCCIYTQFYRVSEFIDSADYQTSRFA